MTAQHKDNYIFIPSTLCTHKSRPFRLASVMYLGIAVSAATIGQIMYNVIIHCEHVSVLSTASLYFQSCLCVLV